MQIWVLAPGSAHSRPSARPHINISRNFTAHVSAESPSNISPNPSEVIGTLGQLLKFSIGGLISPFFCENKPPGGQGLGVRILFFY